MGVSYDLSVFSNNYATEERNIFIIVGPSIIEFVSQQWKKIQAP